LEKEHWLDNNIGFEDGSVRIYDNYEKMMGKGVWLMEITYENVCINFETVNIIYNIENVEFIDSFIIIWSFKATSYYYGLFFE
jgi:hypothetical protein